jgi:hypothetical protein
MTNVHEARARINSAVDAMTGTLVTVRLDLGRGDYSGLAGALDAIQIAAADAYACAQFIKAHDRAAATLDPKSRAILDGLVADGLITSYAEDSAEAARYCPICHEQVAYVPVGTGHFWVHVGDGRFLSQTPTAHDVNTYAPGQLLETRPS